MLTRILLWVLLIGLAFRAIARLVRGVAEGAGGPEPRPGRRNGSTTPARGEVMVRDPVCGTFVVPSQAKSVRDRLGTHHFCSDKCRNEYVAR